MQPVNLSKKCLSLSWNLKNTTTAEVAAVILTAKCQLLKCFHVIAIWASIEDLGLPWHYTIVQVSRVNNVIQNPHDLEEQR